MGKYSLVLVLVHIHVRGFVGGIDSVVDIVVEEVGNY